MGDSLAKSKEKKCLMPSKAKKGSVLRAIEDIQRLPPETICEEFDRLIESTQRHFRKEALMPCTGVANKLQYCLHSNQQQSYKCFDVMEEYRQCVMLATQDHIDDMAVNHAKSEAEAGEDQGRQQPEQPSVQALPMVPSKLIPPPAMSVESKRHRSWYKPWSWLR